MQNFQSFSKIVCSLCISQIKQAMCINASIPVVSARFTDGIQMIYRGEQAYHNKSIYARTLAIIYPNISSAIKSTRFSAIFFKMEVVFINSLIPSRLALSISGRIGMASFTNPAYLYLPLLCKTASFLPARPENIREIIRHLQKHLLSVLSSQGLCRRIINRIYLILAIFCIHRPIFFTVLIIRISQFIQFRTNQT